MDDIKKCPYCGTDNKLFQEGQEEMKQVGKAVIDCAKCSKLFVVRDDGDGEYVFGEPCVIGIDLAKGPDMTVISDRVGGR